MSKTITVTMTITEARELLSCAGNGYGDGDFYGCNDGGNNGKPANGQARAHSAYLRATEKLSKACYSPQAVKRSPLSTGTRP